ncbi:MAG: hypothetical protein M3O46_12105 [Myxococcota bacterium]|nr:hypothetical protein [Myxococcota bacterium]
MRHRSLLRVRALFVLSSIMALVFVAPLSWADDRPPELGFLVGASTFVAAFVVGGMLATTSHGNDAQENAGWLTMEGGFVMAPIASHAVMGEWTRAVVFGAPPAAAFAGSATLLGIHPATIERGELADQRVIWSLFGSGLLLGLVGVVDAALAQQRVGRGTSTAHSTPHAKLSIDIVPVLGSGQFGLRVGASI